MSKRRNPLPTPLEDLRTSRSWPKGVPLPKAGEYRANSRWTYEDEETLRRFYPLYGGHYCARVLGRTVAAVRIRGRDLHIQTGKSRRWSKKEIALLKREMNRRSTSELVALTGRSSDSVLRKARELGRYVGARPWTKNERSRLRASYGRVPLKELAKELDRTTHAIESFASELGLTRKLKKTTPAMIKTVVSKVGRVKREVIASELGIGLGRVTRIAQREGQVYDKAWWQRKWTPEEDAYLSAHYSTDYMIDIARRLNRHVATCSSRARHLGLSKESGHRLLTSAWTSGEDTMLRKLYPTRSYDAIADKLNKTRAMVARRVKKLGLRKAPEGRKPWTMFTPEEDDMLRRFHAMEARPSSTEIAAIMDRPKSSIDRRFHMLGLKRDHLPSTKEKPWTPEEDALLRRSYRTRSTADLASELKRTVASVQTHLSKLRLRRRPPPEHAPRPWTDDEDAYLRQSYHKIPAKDIAEQFNRKVTAVIHRAARLGLAGPRGRRKKGA